VTLARALGVQPGPAGAGPFTDWADVPAWSQSSILFLHKLKWINGFPDGSYGPTKSLNRDQAAKVLANFLGMP
jgi:hypothetical protein